MSRDFRSLIERFAGSQAESLLRLLVFISPVSVEDAPVNPITLREGD